MAMRSNPPRLDDGYEDDLNYENLEFSPGLVRFVLWGAFVAIVTKLFGWW